MKIAIVAIGRLARSPEMELVKLYVERATNAGRALGLGPVEVIEVEPRRSSKPGEAEALKPHLADAHVIACDEHGTARPSRAFAEEIGRLRDDGVRRLVFVIGGADGLAASLRDKAQLRLSFGTATWPHQLVRVMLLEQLYRASTILTGHPYHRA